MKATDLTMPVLGGTRILVVDAHEDSAAALTAVFRLNGFDAKAALTIADSLASAREKEPRVLVIDPALPQGDWRKLVRRLKASTPSMALVVLTGDTDPSIRKAATEAGASAFLLKPAEPTELVKLLQKLSD